MSAPTASVGWPSRLKSAIGPRGGLVVLVGVHLALTLLQSWPVPYQIDRWHAPSPIGVTDFITSASEAVLLAPLALIAAYVALGGGRWIVRIIRGGLLLLWYELAHMAGTRWLDGGRDVRGFEVFLAQDLWTFGFLALPLLLYRLFARREVTVPYAPPTRPQIQFRIIHLLLITTEAGAVMGALRALVDWDKDSWEHLWLALKTYVIEYASFDMIALGLLSAVPALLVTLRFRSLKWAAVVLASWETVFSLGFVGYRFLLPELDPQFQFVNPNVPGWIWGGYWLTIATFCCTVALDLWLSLAIVRWFGYEFLPRPRRGGGRQSSEATSAA